MPKRHKQNRTIRYTPPIKLELKEIDVKAGMFSGYANTHNVVDAHGHMLVSGAWETTIKERGPDGDNTIKVMKQHDPTLMLGKPVRLEDDEKGLFHESVISDTALGRDTIILLKDGIYDQHSVTMAIVQSNTDSEMQAEVVTEAALYEISIVAWGANSVTPVMSVKGAVIPPEVSLQQIINYADRIEECLGSNYWHAKETPLLLQLSHNLLKQMLERYQDNLAKQQTPLPAKIQEQDMINIVNKAFSINTVPKQEFSGVDWKNLTQKLISEYSHSLTGRN